MFREGYNRLHGVSVPHFQQESSASLSCNFAGLPMKLGVWHTFVYAGVQNYVNHLTFVEILDCSAHWGYPSGPDRLAQFISGPSLYSV